MYKAINRTTVQTADDKYRLYPKSSPIFYKKSDGSYNEIDLTSQSKESKTGLIQLYDKNVVSVGIRKDNNAHKLVGIRPDYNQETGDQQMEFSLINVSLDNKNIDVDLNNDYEVAIKGNKIYQFIKTNQIFQDFKVEYDIHLKGLEIVNEKYDQKATIREYKSNVVNLGSDKGINIIKAMQDAGLFKEDYAGKNNIELYTGLINDNYITTGEYTKDEEFGSNDLSSFDFFENMYPNGSSIYLKDCIVIGARSKNIENLGYILAENIYKEYGLEFFQEDNGGNYFVKDNKKVGGYYCSNNQFFGFINTKSIDDDIKSIFIKKTFNDVSYLDILFDDFYNLIENNIGKSIDKIEVNEQYFKPIDNKFKIKINKEYFYIKRPLVVLSDETINPGTLHTLKDNNDGTYRYTKYYTIDSILKIHQSQVSYIDVTLGVSEDEARPFQFHTGPGATSGKTSSRVRAWRNDTTSSNYQDDTGASLETGSFVYGNNFGRRICGDGGLGSGGNVFTKAAWYYQTHYIFDSSGISDTIGTLSWNHLSQYYSYDSSYQSIPEDISIIFLKSNTEHAGSGGDWNDFDGHTGSWGSGDVTEYSGEVIIDGTETVLSSRTITEANADWYENLFNSNAMTDISDNDTFKFAVIDYDMYYLYSYNGSYGAASSGNGYRFHISSESDNDTVDLRPYLEYTIATAATDNATFFGCNF